MKSYAENLRAIFALITFISLGSFSLLKIGTVDLHSIISTATLVVPAIVIMSFLGYKMGEIIDSPTNRADADYKIAVMNALKKLDKNMTMEELNEKLSKVVNEPDSSDSISIDDLDV